MVKALLAGTKTQTRRLPERLDPKSGTGVIPSSFVYVEAADGRYQVGPIRIRIEVGDRLWVREAYRVWDGLNATPPRDFALDTIVVYEAGGSSEASEGYRRFSVWPGVELEWPKGLGKLRPGIHMPRWASRLTLTVTDVRVERLQDISAADAIAEGVTPLSSGRYHCGHDDEGQVTAKSPVTAYAWLWDSINGEGAWQANPWVVAYTFTVERRNIDGVGQ